MCAGPRLLLYADAADEYVEGVSIFPGNVDWLIRLWGFPQNESTVNPAHLKAVANLIREADIETVKENAIRGRSIISVVGHGFSRGRGETLT